MEDAPDNLYLKCETVISQLKIESIKRRKAVLDNSE